jgi:beta-xylosidase/AraC-like DNA-binding protein
MAVQIQKDESNNAGAWIYHPIGPVTMHSASDLELIFVLDGKLDVREGNRTHRLKQSDILFLNPPQSSGPDGGSANSLAAYGDTRRRIFPAGDCYFLFLRIAPAFLSMFSNETISIFECNSSVQHDRNFDTLRGILAEIASADTLGARGFMFYSRLYRLLDELDTHFSVPGEEEPGENDVDGQRRRMARRYLEKHFRFPVGLEDLARALSLSPHYLSKHFKKLFGVNFHTYLTRLRFDNALRDLWATDNPVTAVAYDNGFPNLTAFISEMKEVLGQTPTAYRESLKVKDREDNGQDKELPKVDPSLVRDKLSPFIGDGTKQARKKLSVDARSGGPLETPWREIINLGFASDFEKSDFIAQIRLIQAEAPFRYARFQGLFGKRMFSLSERECPSFTKIDRIIDFLYSVRLLPFIELAFKPCMVMKNFETFVFSREDEIKILPLEEYEEIIASFLKHAVTRYGMQEVNRWRFELWIPQDGGLNYTEKDITTYLGQFVRLRKMVKAIAPGALIGGPGFNSIWPEHTEIFSRILLSLKADNSLPDFISFYLFGPQLTPTAKTDEEKDSMIFCAKDDIPKRIDWIESHVEALIGGSAGKKEQGFFHREVIFYATEWNIDPSCRNIFHDTLLKAPFVLQNAIDASGRIDALAYWLASDISAEYTDTDTPLFGGPGLVSRHGIRKPAFFAYQFLSKLGGKLLSKGENYIITAKSEYEFSCILFNYKYLSGRFRFIEQIRNLPGDLSGCLEDLENLSFSLEIRNITPGRYKVRQHILNSCHGSVYDTWMRLSALENPLPDEAAWLERVCIPDLKIESLEGKDSISLECGLEPNEVRLIEISLVF